MSPDRRKEIVNELYEYVILTSSRVLHNAKNFSIAVLKLENDPTYTEIAEHMEEITAIINLISDDFDEDFTAGKAKEYSDCVTKIANAIVEGDEEELSRLVEELDKRSFL